MGRVSPCARLHASARTPAGPASWSEVIDPARIAKAPGANGIAGLAPQTASVPRVPPRRSPTVEIESSTTCGDAPRSHRLRDLGQARLFVPDPRRPDAPLRSLSAL